MWWIIGIGVVAVLIIINYIAKTKKENNKLKTIADSAVQFSKLAMEDPEQAKLVLTSESEDEFAKRVFYKEHIRQYLIAIRMYDYYDENKNNPLKYDPGTKSIDPKPEYEAERRAYVNTWRAERAEYFRKDSYTLVISTPEDAPLEQFLAAYKAGTSLCFDANDNKRPWQLINSNK
jgi:hypothetical protein